MAEQQTPKPRLSEKQRKFLQRVVTETRPTDDFPDGLPLYMNHRFMEFDFNTERERALWVSNMEARGFISRSGSGGCFVRPTDAGRAALQATGGGKP
jgi:hypothetical protein